MKRVSKNASERAFVRRSRAGASVAGIALLVGLLLSASAEAAPPSLTVEVSTQVGFVTARAHARVDPAGVDSIYFFEVIPDAHFQQNEAEAIPPFEGAAQTGFGFVGGAEGDTPIEPVLEGLTPGTEYHLRLVAENADGTEAEVGPSFTTQTAVAPTAAIDPAGGVGARMAHVSGGINPEGGNTDPAAGVLPIGWQLQLTRSSEPGAWQPVAEGTIEASEASGTTPIPVTADLEGLDPATGYEFRLVAFYAGSEVVSGTRTFATEAAPPQVTNISVSGVSGAAATVHAEVNPGGTATTYHVEYLTESAFQAAGAMFVGAARTPESPAVGSDILGHAVQAEILGLAEDTAYRYRVVATNVKGTTVSSVGSLHTAAAPISGDSCPNAAVRAQQGSQHLPECRAYEIVSNPGLALGDASRVPAISDDGTTVVYTAPLPDEIALGGGTVTIAVARRGPTGWSQESADPHTFGSTTEHLGLTEPIAFSPDFTRELLDTNLPADPSDSDIDDDYYRVDVGKGTSTLMTQDLLSSPSKPLGASPDLGRVVYLVASNASEFGIYASDGTHKELLSVDENGQQLSSPTAAGSAADRGLNVGVGSAGSHRPFVERGGVHAVSTDAERVYFYGSASTVPGLGTAGSLYLNDHGTSTLIAPVALFLSATADGSSAYFDSLEQLTPGAPVGGGIYRYDVGSKTIELIIAASDPGGLNLTSAMASNDQTHLYFTSGDALAGPAVAGRWNAYVWTRAGGIRFIAPVAEADKFERVTPDGRFALLLSNESIDGAPNDGHHAVYEYDYVSGSVACVSCRPDGSPSQGDASIEDQPFNIPNNPSTPNRALTSYGAVVFNSTDMLTAADESQVLDAYIYDQGKVGLLSSGDEGSPSYVANVSDDGRNVILITRGALVGSDRDPHEYDIYDAAVEGGFLEPAPPAPPCTGDECRGQASGTPPNAVAATAGPVPSEKQRSCSRTKFRSHGRCVKRRRHHKHKHKRKPARHRAQDQSGNGGAGR